MSDQLFPPHSNPGADAYRQKALPLSERMGVCNGWLRKRLETQLPRLLSLAGRRKRLHLVSRDG